MTGGVVAEPFAAGGTLAPEAAGNPGDDIRLAHRRGPSAVVLPLHGEVPVDGALSGRTDAEVAAKGVTVNTVSPGYIATDMVMAVREDVREKIIATIPVKRLGTPEEIGSIVGWLAGEDSGFTTGADFSCNGGLHMG